MRLYGCQQILLYPDKELKAILEFICNSANSLTNCGIYYAQQMYFKAKKFIGKYDLEAEYKTHKYFKCCTLKQRNKYFALFLNRFSHSKS